MKHLCLTLTLLLFFPVFFYGQEELVDDTGHKHDDEHELHDHDHDHDHIHEAEIDTTKVINYWRITERTGEIIAARPDITLTDYFNRTTVEGKGISVAYLGNLGTAAESRYFFDRADRSDFMFTDAYWPYEKTPGRFNFINTKIPHTNISYHRAGSSRMREERLQALLALNINKQLNIGFDVDYLYARGFYANQQTKRLDWTFFGNYIADRHRVHAFISPTDYTNAENGGIVDDRYISNPDVLDAKNINSKDDIQTNINSTWNNIKGKQIYLNYRYNLGFDRETEKLDEDGEHINQFVPVSSIIYTFDYKDRKRKFYTTDDRSLDAFYDNRNYMDFDEYPHDSTAYWSMKNTAALSLREGFSSWAKFDLTAFITQETRRYSILDVRSIIDPESTTSSSFFEDKHELFYRKTYQNSTYVGGELAKRTGEILRYDAQASFGILGYNLSDFNASGHIETRIPILGDTASINLNGHIKNLSPTYYENSFKSKYFFWANNDFSKVRKVFVGGDITVPHTRTKISAGVENLTNYIYFDENGYPQQYKNDIQVVGVQLEQNFKYRALHWNNQVAYQISSEEDILPLPDIALYSSLFVQFPIAKVLTIQAGVNAYYFTKYYSPTYEPGTQQFRLQKEIEVGDYPILSGFLNCHLKQTRFFLEYYNMSPMFISPANYFSMPHYPLNPTILRMGVSIDFIN